MKIAVYSTTGCQPPIEAPVNRLTELLHATETVVWVDMEGPTPEEIATMRDIFRFHPLAIEDTTNLRQRPKVEEYHGYFFSIVNPVLYEEGVVVFGELDVFAGHNFVVTVHGKPELTGEGEKQPPSEYEVAVAAVEIARRRVDEACSVLPMSTGYLLYTLLDVVVDGYFPVVELIGDEIDDIGDEILLHPRQKMLRRLFALKRTLSEMWRVVGQQRDMFSVLQRENSIFISNDSLRFYMRDVHDHLLRIADTVNTFRDTLNNLIDLYMSAVSNRLNRQVNRLTILTIGIGVLTVISGFYGMNFEQTWPPFDADWGVLFVVMLMLITIAVVTYVIRRMERQ